MCAAHSLSPPRMPGSRASLAPKHAIAQAIHSMCESHASGKSPASFAKWKARSRGGPLSCDSACLFGHPRDRMAEASLIE